MAKNDALFGKPVHTSGKPKRKPIPWEGKLIRIAVGLGLVAIGLSITVAPLITIEGRKIPPTETSIPIQPSTVEICATSIAYLNEAGQEYRDPSLYCPGFQR